MGPDACIHSCRCTWAAKPPKYARSGTGACRQPRLRSRRMGGLDRRPRGCSRIALPPRLRWQGGLRPLALSGASRSLITQRSSSTRRRRCAGGYADGQRKRRWWRAMWGSLSSPDWQFPCMDNHCGCSSMRRVAGCFG